MGSGLSGIYFPMLRGDRPRPAQNAEQAAATAASRARSASISLGLLTAAWLVVAVGGLLTLGKGGTSGVYALDGSGVGGLLRTLGPTLVVLLGVPVWALLALWCSWTRHAARAAGRGGDTGSTTGMAWWGLFVPLANLVLPLLAYLGAARSGDATDQGRRGRADVRLVVWWVLFLLAVLAASFARALVSSDQLDAVEVNTYALLYAASGLLGAAGSASGASFFWSSACSSAQAAAAR